MSQARIRIRGLSKTFTLHQQGGIALPVLQGIDLDVQAGECVALDGRSGAGKSTLLKCIYANYLASSGSIEVRHAGETVDITRAGAATLLEVRRQTIGYVSQFLRVIPRVPAIDIVAEELADRAADDQDALREARAQAEGLLQRLRIPLRLWGLPPSTFSGGEQQRVNIARGFIHPRPIMLLDEPTASLDAANRQTVTEMIREARDGGAAIIGIFHDHRVRDAVATRTVTMEEQA